ncbi:hypothetical protein [Pectobacterium versatile]|uniref:hypothetical protein n=1 Tax=Pectobacterium versatile TaxID=2488639 RepID=UPI0037F80BCF
MSVLRFHIGTRSEKGRYGPQSQDMSLSDLLELFSPVVASTQYVFPDLTPLIRHIHEQIEGQFAAQATEQREMKRMQDYNILFNAWSRAATYTDLELRNSDWQAVINKAEHFLVALQQDFPPKASQEQWKSPLVDRIAYIGRLYNEALLFFITARAAREPQSLYRDVTLRGYCHWLRYWVKTYLEPRDCDALLLAAAINKQENYPAVQVLSSDDTPESADVFLATHVRRLEYRSGNTDTDTFPIARRTYIPLRGYESNAKKMCSTLFTLDFNDHHWRLIYTLRDLLYRADRLEAFLTELEQHGDSVAFDQQGYTTETVQALLRGHDSQPPTLPEE